MRRVLVHPIAPLVGCALGCLAYVIAHPATADMAAHAYRAWLFQHEGGANAPLVPQRPADFGQAFLWLDYRHHRPREKIARRHGPIVAREYPLARTTTVVRPVRARRASSAAAFGNRCASSMMSWNVAG